MHLLELSCAMVEEKNGTLHPSSVTICSNYLLEKFLQELQEYAFRTFIKATKVNGKTNYCIGIEK